MTIKTKQFLKVIGWFAFRIAIILLAIACIAFPILLYYSNIRAAERSSSVAVSNVLQGVIQPAAATVNGADFGFGYSSPYSGFATPSMPVAMNGMTAITSGETTTWRVGFNTLTPFNLNAYVFLQPNNKYYLAFAPGYNNATNIHDGHAYDPSYINGMPLPSPAYPYRSVFRMVVDYTDKIQGRRQTTAEFEPYLCQYESDGTITSIVPLFRSTLIMSKLFTCAFISKPFTNISSTYTFYLPFTIFYSGEFDYTNVVALNAGISTSNAAFRPLSSFLGNSSPYEYSFFSRQSSLNRYFNFAFSNHYSHSTSVPTGGLYSDLRNFFTYYVNSSDIADTLYDEGFAAGSQIGYNQGFQAGAVGGYANGYEVGSTDGYNMGFSAGVASANDYSFLGLIGAVFDAPIQAISGLLSFEILGFNVKTFVLSLFTLCVVLKLVSVITGGVGS